MQINRQQRQEQIVYVVLWAALLIAPVISVRLYHTETDFYPWKELLGVWKQMGLFFVAFLIHNYLLAPLLVYRQKRVWYFACILALTSCFVLIQCVDHPLREGRMHRHERMEQRHELPPVVFEPHGEPPIHGKYGEFRRKPPLGVGQHEVMATVVLVLMLGVNVGVKLYFKGREDQHRLEKLEKENLHQQLEYLRYQINPHFLMNTLNNIHALVDIDGERAKETIVELSKIMRYALYEGARQTVPLGRDVAFLESYIRLMKIRYSDKVEISIDIPSQLPEQEIPPMLFITFVENAFKHGISYRQHSFIKIALRVEKKKVIFTCCNSKFATEDKNDKPQGGVGLKNVQKRLQLLYGDSYKFDIDDGLDKYNIRLEIPL